MIDVYSNAKVEALLAYTPFECEVATLISQAELARNKFKKYVNIINRLNRIPQVEEFAKNRFEGYQ